MKLFQIFIFFSFSMSSYAVEINPPEPTKLEPSDKIAAKTANQDMLHIAEQEIDFDEQQLLLKQKKLNTQIEFCAPCHGKNGLSDVPIYPNLAGQHQEYLLKQLLAFKYRRRKDSIMQGMVSRLNEDDMLELAKYYANISIGFSQTNVTGEANENYN